MEEDEEEDTAGIEVKKTSKKGLSKFLSQIFRHSEAPDKSITKQATDDTQWKQMWIRKEPDEDGYFLVQLEETIGRNNMFLTAEDASSLTIACK